jgi:hypothetical protein
MCSGWERSRRNGLGNLKFSEPVTDHSTNLLVAVGWATGIAPKHVRRSTALAGGPSKQARDDQSPGSHQYLVTERQWELFRLRIVIEWRDSPFKAAVVAAIKHNLSRSVGITV